MPLDISPIVMSQQDIDDIVAFLEAVSLVPEPEPLVLRLAAMGAVALLARRRKTD